MKRRGAEQVAAIDVARLGNFDWLPSKRARVSREASEDQGWPRRFATAHTMRDIRVEYHICNIYDLSPEAFGMFDLVYCGRLLLHLKNPLQALINIHSVTKERAVVETGAIDRDAEERFSDRPYLFFGHLHAEKNPGDNDVFWEFSTKALCNMLIHAGFSRAEPQPRFHMSNQLDVVAAVGVVQVVHPSSPLILGTVAIPGR